METNIVEIKNMVTSMSDPVQVAAAWVTVQNAKRLIREIDDTLKQYALDIMQREDIREIILGDGVKIYRAKDNKDRFETEYIYKALAFTDEQQAVLPKNPAWRKTAILANEKTSPAHSIDESEKIVIKELDENVMKALGRK